MALLRSRAPRLMAASGRRASSTPHEGMSGSPFPTRDSELQAFAAVSTGRRGEGGGEGRGEG